MKKKVCVFTGIGFGDQKELIAKMEDVFGWQVSLVEVGASVNVEDIPAGISNAELIFLRAPWSATFEEAIYAEYLSEKLSRIFSVIQERIRRGERLKILGIGRGAWTLLKADLESSGQFRHLEWESAHVDGHPWSSFRIFGDESQFMAQAHSLFLPKVDVSAQGQMKPWMILGNGQVGGWRVSKHLYLAWLDPFSYAHPSQLRDYGYIDHAKVQSSDDFLARFARADDLEL
jgi:hypothetical protein